MNTKTLFIAATDTNVGKTYVAVQLIRELKNLGLKVGAYKPVASGGALDDPDGDPLKLAEAAGIDSRLLGKVCPQSFQAPLAPPVAARLEGRIVDEELLLAGMDWWQGRCDWLIVESAGGLMSPVSETQTVIDVAQQMDAPILLIVPNRLGCISHALLALDAIRHRDLICCGVLLNDLPAALADADRSVIQSTNFELLSQFRPEQRLYRSVLEVVQSLKD